MVIRKFGNKTIGLIISCLIVLALIFMLFLDNGVKEDHKEIIHDFISSKGGTVLSIEPVSIDSTPFPVYSENGRRRQEAGNKFYKISYSKDGSEFTAWYRGVNGTAHQYAKSRSRLPIEETPENDELIYSYGERWIISE